VTAPIVSFSLGVFMAACFIRAIQSLIGPREASDGVIRGGFGRLYRRLGAGLAAGS
jgi:hypothetical protein